MNTSEFYNNLIISSILPFETDKQSTISKCQHQRFLDGLALLLNDSNQSTVVYPLLKENKILITCNQSLKDDDKIYFDKFFGLIREYTQHYLTSNQDEMNKIYLELESIIFTYHKDKCIKSILDRFCIHIISNLEELLNANIDNLCQNITYNYDQLNKGSTDYIFLKKYKISLKEYILILFKWVNDIISCRNSINNNKNNPELQIIIQFQRTAGLLYYSKLFRLILSQVYSIDNDTERIQYYLDKVLAYHRSLDLILKILKQEKFDYDKLFNNIQSSFIESIENIFILSEILSFSFDKI